MIYKELSVSAVEGLGSKAMRNETLAVVLVDVHTHGKTCELFPWVGLKKIPDQQATWGHGCLDV